MDVRWSTAYPEPDLTCICASPSPAPRIGRNGSLGKCRTSFCARATSLVNGHPTSLRLPAICLMCQMRSWMHDWLDGTGLPFIVVPGNHDHRGDFLSAFESVSPERSLGGWQFIGFDGGLDDERAAPN